MEPVTFQSLLLNNRRTDVIDDLIQYQQLEVDIKQLTGFNLKQLRTLFAMGVTLKRPGYDLSLNQLQTLAELGLEWRK